MSKLTKFIWIVFVITVLVIGIATLGFCGMTIIDACSDGELSISVAQYYPETTPDIYDEV